MKKQNGVTMIELVVVIIIILIITSFSIFTGKEAADQATATEIYEEINAVREAINAVNIKKELDDNFMITSGDYYDAKVSEVMTKEQFETMYGIYVDEVDFDNLYIIFGMDNLEYYDNSNVNKNYGLDSIKHSYLVNFEEGKVELLKTIKIANRSVRTFEQVRALVDDGEI